MLALRTAALRAAALRAAALRIGTALAVSAAVLTACSSSKPTGPTPSTTSPSSSAPVLSAELPRTSTALATAMRHGLAVATSAHVTLSAVPRYGRISGSMTLAGGTPTSLDVTSGSGSSAVHLVVVNSVAYAQLGTATTWTPLPSSGKVPAQLRRARAILRLTRGLADPAAVLTELGSARVVLLGRGRVGDVPAAHYRLTLASGAKQVRTDLWVDGGSRPLTVRNAGTGTVEFSAYGAAVHILAPAPSQIAG